MVGENQLAVQHQHQSIEGTLVPEASRCLTFHYMMLELSRGNHQASEFLDIMGSPGVKGINMQ